MKQQEVKKELKLKAAKSGGKVTPVTGRDEFFRLNNLNSACSTITFRTRSFFLTNQKSEYGRNYRIKDTCLKNPGPDFLHHLRA